MMFFVLYFALYTIYYKKLKNQSQIKTIKKIKNQTRHLPGLVNQFSQF